MDEKDERHLGRRRLLRGAGAVAAGLAGAGVAEAVVATPASADQGQPVLAGLNNTATDTTGIELTDATPARNTKAALRLRNPDGPALTAEPVPFDTVSTAPPPGSIYVDTVGDISTVYAGSGGTKFNNFLYSPRWATMPVPFALGRWLDTRDETDPGTAFVVPNSGTISAGRIVPKGTDQPDLELNFADLLVENYVAVQMVISVLGATADGWVSVWGDGLWPGSISVNFLGGRVIGGFAQSELTGVFVNSEDPFGRLKIKITHRAAVTIDVVGFITPDPFVLFQPLAQQRLGIATARVPKRAPRTR